MLRRAWLVGLASALLVAPAARAGTGLFVGFADDALKGSGSSSAAAAAARDLGASGFRISVNWDGSQTTLAPADDADLDRAVAAAAGGLKIVLVVVGATASLAPQTDSARDTYCTYTRNVLARYPAIGDIAIWNEPNKTASWRPQFNPDGSSSSPAAYEALLARCYDLLHAARPSVNILGLGLSPDGNDNPNAPTNISHSPGNFIRRLGDAYRGSGRALRILDTVAYHVYGATSAERPWRQHPGQTRIAQGDWDKLMTNLHTAFDGTGQQPPGQCLDYRCVSIWYMEGGYQTQIDASKSQLYSGTENVPVVPDDAGGEPASPPPSPTSAAPDQATQIVDGIQLAYCQNYVGSFFNFLLTDEAILSGWQSGALWADGTPKDSYDEFQQAIGEANARSVDCTQLKGGIPPRPDTVAPAAPVGLAATAAGSRVVLDWSDASETDVEGFDVYRSTTAGGPYTKLNAEPVAASAFIDATVAAGQTYYYTVLAVDTAENLSPPSAEASATTQVPTAVAVRSFSARRRDGAVELRWRAGADSRMLGFHLYRSLAGRQVRLDRVLITARGGGAEGVYSFRDRGASRGGAAYSLELVSLEGTRTIVGRARVSG